MADREAAMKAMQGANVGEEPAVGIPYVYPPGTVHGNGVAYPMAAPAQQIPLQYQQQRFLGGSVPPNAIVGHPDGIPLQETVYGDTPAPFGCPYCSFVGVTQVKPKFSFATCVACLISGGICFLCPGCDCLWHKEHYCPSCLQKVAEFSKSDACAVVDPMQWVQPSYAVPA